MPPARHATRVPDPSQQTNWSTSRGVLDHAAMIAERQRAWMEAKPVAGLVDEIEGVSPVDRGRERASKGRTPRSSPRSRKALPCSNITRSPGTGPLRWRKVSMSWSTRSTTTVESAVDRSGFEPVNSKGVDRGRKLGGRPLEEALECLEVLANGAAHGCRHHWGREVAEA